jgi:hypothetical protein
MPFEPPRAGMIAIVACLSTDYLGHDVEILVIPLTGLMGSNTKGTVSLPRDGMRNALELAIEVSFMRILNLERTP